MPPNANPPHSLSLFGGFVSHSPTPGITSGQATGVALREWGALYPAVYDSLTAVPDRSTHIIERLPRSHSKTAQLAQAPKQSNVLTAGQATQARYFSGGGPGQAVGGGVSLDERYESGSDSEDAMPGPGQYEIASTGPSGPSFSMRAKVAHRTAADEETPGGVVRKERGEGCVCVL